MLISYKNFGLFVCTSSDACAVGWSSEIWLCHPRVPHLVVIWLHVYHSHLGSVVTFFHLIICCSNKFTLISKAGGVNFPAHHDKWILNQDEHLKKNLQVLMFFLVLTISDFGWQIRFLELFQPCRCEIKQCIRKKLCYLHGIIVAWYITSSHTSLVVEPNLKLLLIRIKFFFKHINIASFKRVLFLSTG